MRDRAFLGECLVDMRGIHGRRQGEGQRNDRDQCARYPERQPLAIGRHRLRLARYQARRKQVAPRPIPHPDARPSPFAPLRDGYISSFLLNCTDKPYHGSRSLEFALAGAFDGQQDEPRGKRSPYTPSGESVPLYAGGSPRMGPWELRLNGQLFKTLRAHSRLRVAAVLLCLLACTLQSFVAQTHVHSRPSQTPDSAGYHAGALSDTASPLSIPDDDYPKHGRRDSSTSCPLCQIVLHGGAAPAPTFASSLPVLAATSLAPLEQAPAGAVVAVSFSWQGRAPPLT
jgi:hypothetical protein